MKKFFSLCLCALLLAACAEKSDGIFVMNEETIENFFEKAKKSWNPASSLNLVSDQPVTSAAVPDPDPGQARLMGTLASDGSYTFIPAGSRENVFSRRGGEISNSVFGMLGPAGTSGNAWFYADFNPQTGQIANARAYLYGIMGGACDLREMLNDSYGNIDQDGFRLHIAGYCLFPELSGSEVEFAILLQGTGRLFNTTNGYIPVRFVLDNTGRLASIPLQPRLDNAVYAFGSGQARLANAR